MRELVSSASLDRPMIGGAIFNMDRELPAMILPCGDRVAAIEPPSVDAMLKRAMTTEERVLAKVGVRFSTLKEDERRYFRDADGLFAREVWLGTPGEAAGIRPGDLLAALNGQPVTTIDDLRPLMMHPEAPFELRVRRGSRTETLTFGVSAVSPTSSDKPTTVGLVFEPTTPTYRIESLLPGSRADRAGLKPGDRASTGTNHAVERRRNARSPVRDPRRCCWKSNAMTAEWPSSFRSRRRDERAHLDRIDPAARAMAGHFVRVLWIPEVTGYILVGVALGPSMLGWLSQENLVALGASVKLRSG